MIHIISWTSMGFLGGYILMDFINYYHYRLYNTNISNFIKYNIVICITILAFIRGYTGNDLITNMQKLDF
jgi:hypothetical protein